MDAIYEVHGLTKRYGRTAALNGVDFAVTPGKLVGLLGPNGSGKTTLMKISAGLLQPTAGSVIIDKVPVGVFTKAVTSYLPDRMALPTEFTADDAVSLYADFFTDFDKVKANAMLADLHLNQHDRIGAMSKGSGMIHPNMATMLCFVTTDCAISVPMLQKAIKAAADTTFNMISVDGDTSTNDTLAIMANGEAENEEITEENEAYKTFLEALTAVCRKLSMMMAGDGEGATKLLICKTTGAKDWETAKTVAKSVICSSLLKAAMFGEDANWGRVLCAIGYAGADIDINKVDVSFKSAYGQVDVCVNGAGINFSEEEAAKVLHEKEITILVELNSGDAEAEAFGCDLTYDYVKINGDYRT